MKKSLNFIGNTLWDIFCTISIAGIWPRFIEPQIISSTSLKLPVKNLPDALIGLKILQISDLHLNSSTSDRFLEKLLKKITAFQPDLIVFTGDFLCYSELKEPKRLLSLLKRFDAPFGCYTVLGNHDYNECVSINFQGDYDVVAPTSFPLKKAFSRFFKSIKLTSKTTDRAKNVQLHPELLSLLSETPFKLMHNATEVIKIRDAKLNLTGLGEHMLGKTNPVLAFKDFDRQWPGLILLHNPDGIACLKDYPGDIVLSGHTHGGQINLPWVWKKFTLLENMNLKKGLKKIHDKWLYINRGVGSALPFRWFSMPEILLLTLEKSA